MKGQGAMEYLMTYGWALLVIVVAGAALFALGVLNPSTYSQKRCTGFEAFTYQDQQATAAAFTLDVYNGKDPITVTAMSVNGVAVQNLATNPAGTIPGSTRFTATGDGLTNGAAGTSYSFTVAVTYNVQGGIQGNIDRATCSGTIA